MANSFLILSTERYAASVACLIASRGFESIFHSPDPHVVESVRKYDPEIYHFIGKERYIKLLSEKALTISDSPPHKADTLIICGETLRDEPTLLRHVENLVVRVAATTSIHQGIIFSVLGRPGTTSKLVKLYRRHARDEGYKLPCSYVGLVHRQASVHPYYSEDERTDKLIPSIVDGPHLKMIGMENAEASAIVYLALEAVQKAVIQHASAVLGIEVEAQQPHIDAMIENAFKFLSEREATHRKLLTYVKAYLNKMFMESCHSLGRRIKELMKSKAGVLNILLVSEDGGLADYVSRYLPSRGCRVYQKNPSSVYEVVERLGRLDVDYDLVVMDDKLPRTAQLLADILGWGRIHILCGIRPPTAGV